MNKMLKVMLIGISVYFSACQADDSAVEVQSVVMWEDEKAEASRQVLQTVFVDSFNQAHPDIDLELIIQEDIVRVTRTALQAKSGPDIVYTKGPAYVHDYVNAGFIQPLDPYLDDFGFDISDFYSWAFDLGRYDDQLYTLPLTFESLILWYNTTLFEEHGWTPPSNRVELEALCAAMTAKDIVPFIIGNAIYTNVNEWYISAFLNAYAGPEKMYDLLTGATNWTDPTIMEAIDLLVEYFQNGWIGGSIEDYFSLGYDDSWLLFSDGKGAMKISGTWAFDNARVNFEATDQEWDWVKIPALRDGVRSVFPMAVGASIGINEYSENPAAAAKVIDWIYNDPIRSAKIMEGLDGAEWVLPRSFGHEAMDQIAMDQRWERFILDFSNDSTDAMFGYASWTFLPAKTNSYLYEAFDSVLGGDVSVQAYRLNLPALYADEVSDLRISIPVPSGRR